MNECTICKCRTGNLNFRFDLRAPDGKLAFVERVCGLLIESRFGRGRAYDMVTYLQPKPDGRTDVFYMATDEGFLPPYDIDPVDNALLDQIEEDIARRHGIIFVQRPADIHSPSTLGRGSPLTTWSERSTAER